MARNPNRGSESNKPKTYTDKNRPSGFYNVAGKGKRYWNAYTKSWSKSPLGSTDKMLSKATGRDVTATTQRIKKAASGGAKGGASGASGPLNIKKASNSGTPRSRTNKKTTTTSPSSSTGPKRPQGATGGRGGSTYKPRPVRGPLKDKPKTSEASAAPQKNEAPAAPKQTAKQKQKADFNNTYKEARAKALKIKDAKKRAIALEGVTQMGREFHKKYYNKK
tara:strand:- start:913 stop:1575 length:663 start_codon:yes stop_codon:yes gene_type:complete